MAPHSTRSLSDGANSYLVLKFMPEALYDAGQQLCGLKYIFPYIHFSEVSASVYTKAQLDGSRMRELLMAIQQERHQQAYGYEMALHAYISQVMLWFLRAWQKQAGTGAVGERELLRLQRAQQYIDEHIDESLRQEDVAQHLGMGLSTFSRFFSETSGMSFPAYVRVRRLNKAAALLAQSSRPVTEIAAETGFSTASYLILCFRKQYGVTPAQFRKLSSVEA
jgi:AraC-like DNA-binding protein